MTMFRKGQNYRIFINGSVVAEETSCTVTRGVDTEDAEVNEIVINGQKAITITNHKTNAIIWYDSRFAYTIHGNIAQQELLKIVKNIETN